MNELPQTIQRIIPVLLLTSELLRLDRHDAVCRNSMIPQLQQSLFIQRRQRGRSDVETQMDSRRHFVDVLPPCALRSHGMKLDLRIGNHDVRRYVQHVEVYRTHADRVLISGKAGG